MKLNRTASYAVHALVYIAQQGDERPIIGHAAAKEMDIPEGFLLRILVGLSHAGLLYSIKGPNGGYHLGRPPKTITLLNIVEAAEGSVAGRADPLSDPPDVLDKTLSAMTTAAADSVRKELGRVTLADLVGGRKKVR